MREYERRFGPSYHGGELDLLYFEKQGVVGCWNCIYHKQGWSQQPCKDCLEMRKEHGKYQLHVRKITG